MYTIEETKLTDLEKLDGITNGTAAANKALVADANIDVVSLEVEVRMNKEMARKVC